jgi:hypothetical protein
MSSTWSTVHGTIFFLTTVGKTTVDDLSGDNLVVPHLVGHAQHRWDERTLIVTAFG